MNGVAEGSDTVTTDATRALIARLVETGDPYAALGAYAHVPQSARAELADVALATPRLRLIVAAAPYAPADLLDLLSHTADAPLTLRLSKNPATPLAALRRLLGNAPAERVRRYVAAHPRADAALLAELADDAAIEVRRAVAANENTPAEVIARLGMEHDGQMARNVAAAPQADSQTLRRLWTHDAAWVRAEVVAHPNSPADILAEAEVADDPLIRRKYAANPAISGEALVRLLTDPDLRVDRI